MLLPESLCMQTKETKLTTDIVSSYSSILYYANCCHEIENDYLPVANAANLMKYSFVGRDNTYTRGCYLLSMVPNIFHALDLVVLP